MIEVKLINSIQTKYRELLHGFFDIVRSDLSVKLDREDIKRLLFQVRIFWYRQKSAVQYILDHIEESDDISFLAGAVRLDITSNGHYEYIVIGKHRIVNDPFMKMTIFFKPGTEELADEEYFINYVNDSFRDVIDILDTYHNDFWVFPLEYISDNDSEKYHETLLKVSNKLLRDMFVGENESLDDIEKNFNDYESIETALRPGALDMLIFSSLLDHEISLRERVKKYIEENPATEKLYNGMSEFRRFSILVTLHLMQALGIINCSVVYHMTPFVRNEVVFNYCYLIFQGFEDTIKPEVFLKTYIGYILTSKVDFTDMPYEEVREKFGNGIIIDEVAKTFESRISNKEIPRPIEIDEEIQKVINQK